MCQQCLLEWFGRENDDEDFIFPLSFDDASGGRIATSKFPLFQLPADVCNHILSHLNASALRTLSLVDRDCQTLARTLQFYRASMSFPRFMDALATEAKRNSKRSSETTGSRTNITPVGVCIRRLKIVTAFPDLPDVVRLGLPNLVHVTLVNYHAKSRHLLDALARSPGIRHLIITKFFADKCGDDGSPASDTSERLWPSLKSLEVQISGSKCAAATLRFLEILWHSSPTLQSLKWAYTQKVTDPADEGMLLIFSHISFPNLETLALQNTQYQDLGLFDLFFPPRIDTSDMRLKTLLLTSSKTGLERQLFTRGRIPSLKSFHYHNYSTEPSLTSFLASNYLTTFTMSEPLPTSTIDEILSISSLGHLTTLALIFPGLFVPRTSLSLLSSLTCLTHLWITVKPGMEGVYWLAPHTEFISALEPLRRLQYLAFGSDGYTLPGTPDFNSLGTDPFNFTVNNYYSTFTFPAGTSIASYLTDWEMNYLSASERSEGDRWLKMSEKKKAWERWHKDQMCSIVIRYAKAFPLLKWCFIGQLPMRIERGESNSEKGGDPEIIVKAEVNRRNDPTFLEYLWKTWGSRVF